MHVLARYLFEGKHTTMARLTITIGILLTLLGVAFYVGLTIDAGTRPSVTALIPAFAGLPILLLGVAALKESIRKHAMHGVALLALLGFLLPVGRLGLQLARGADIKPTVLVSLVLMAVLCGMLLAACVRSFVRARLGSSAN
jgi:hypothetical protein